MSNLSKISNFYFLTPLYHDFKILHFDANPITFGYLVEGFVNAKKEFEHRFCQYLKNNIANIRLIPLDHVTYNEYLTYIYTIINTQIL